MRLMFCVICGEPIPQGGRIDRRYCRESCRVQAYRQRHKHGTITRRPEGTGTGEAPASEPSASTTLPPETARLAAEQATAREQIKELASQNRALQQRALSIELKHEEVQRRMAAMEAAIRQLRAAGADTAVQSAQEPIPSASTENKHDAPESSSSNAPLPWMMPSADPLVGPTPKWTLMREDYFAKIDARIDDLLTPLPDAMKQLGLSYEALQLRMWQRSEVRTLRCVARALARRFICTERSARTTEPQIRSLIKLALDDLATPHPSEETGDKEAWAALLAKGQRTLIPVAALIIQQFRESDNLLST